MSLTSDLTSKQKKSWKIHLTPNKGGLTQLTHSCLEVKLKIAVKFISLDLHPIQTSTDNSLSNVTHLLVLTIIQSSSLESTPIHSQCVSSTVYNNLSGLKHRNIFCQFWLIFQCFSQNTALQFLPQPTNHWAICFQVWFGKQNNLRQFNLNWGESKFQRFSDIEHTRAIVSVLLVRNRTPLKFIDVFPLLKKQEISLCSEYTWELQKTWPHGLAWECNASTKKLASTESQHMLENLVVQITIFLIAPLPVSIPKIFEGN